MKNILAYTILLTLLVATGIGYSMWIDRVSINVYIDPGEQDTSIVDQKACQICKEENEHHCCCCNHDHHDNTSYTVITDINITSDGSRIYIYNIECCNTTHHGCNHDGGCCNSIDDDKLNCRNCHHHDHSEGNETILWVGFILRNNGDIPMRVHGVQVVIYGSYGDYDKTYYFYGGNYVTVPENIWDNINCTQLPYSGYTTNKIIDPNRKAVVWLKLSLENCTTIYQITITPIIKAWNIP